MTDERSRYDGDPPPPLEPLVDTLPCDGCGEPSTHFSPHSREPLCWLCATTEEEGVASKMLSEFGTATGRDVYDLIERHRDRCYERAGTAAAREVETHGARDPEEHKRQWNAAFDRRVNRELAELVHRIRCNVTLSPWRGVDPLEVLTRMLEE